MKVERKNKPLELWGGVECTFNRVQDSYFDQLKYNGHYSRVSDIRLFADLGLKTLRYPFLWEHIAPRGVEEANWEWADERISALKAAGITVIAGFVHHGSGPRYTDLLDPQFAQKLTAYARAFAERYPEIEYYTPVNEQVTTARFSALYGHWYPHLKDEKAFYEVLINECRGTVLSMRAIRKVNRAAKLVQTDDLGRASSTPLLKYQADHENHRRWLGFDLLCGTVDPNHPLWERMLSVGVNERDLKWFQTNKCPPDIIGLNTYLLSNRHLDERLELYPRWSHGGNGRHEYADVESVRIAGVDPVFPESLILETWQRYGIPIAITEVHVDAPHEDQVRWLLDIWRTCQMLRKEGVDVEAVTAWGLLGHYDWNCLVTQCVGYYESGAFDLRAPEPRPTALARAIEAVAKTGEYDHPVLQVPGWWRRPTRVLYPKPTPIPEPFEPGSFAIKVSERPKIRPLLITGARGTLGRAFAKACEERGLPYCTVARSEMDISNSSAVRDCFERLNPWAVINAAGYVRVDDAEREQEDCYRDNVVGPLVLAQVSAERDIPLVTFSSDLVFDGALNKPYVESSPASPLNVYGRSKAQAEQGVLVRNAKSLIIRTSAFFGPWDDYNFLTIGMRALAKGEEFKTVSDVKVSPTYVPDLVKHTLNLLMDAERGIWHLTNDGEVTWSELALMAAKKASLPIEKIVSVSFGEVQSPARRPQYSVLTSERGRLLPTLDEALSRYFQEWSGQ